MPQRVDAGSFDEAVREAGHPVLVEFYSDTCIPCKRLAPVLSRLEERYAGRVGVVKVNAAYDAELAQAFAVMSSPTLVIVDGTREVARTTGFKREEELVAFVDQALGLS